MRKAIGGHKGRPGYVGGSSAGGGGGKLPPISSEQENAYPYELYHATGPVELESIKEKGLLTEKGKVAFLSSMGSGIIYASLDEENIRRYGSEVVVIKPSHVRLPDLETDKGYDFQEKWNKIGENKGAKEMELYVKKHRNEIFAAGYDGILAPESWAEDIVYILRDIAPSALVIK